MSDSPTMQYIAHMKGYTLLGSVRAIHQTHPQIIADLDLAGIKGRDRTMILAYCAGYTYREIGHFFGLSKQGIAKRLKKYRDNKRLTAIFCTPTKDRTAISV